jgi:hypothetical protein
MALTLVEAAKLHSGNVVRSAVIETYARSSDILRVLPFEGIDGNAYQYNLEETLPGIGFRGVNESWNESTGIINPLTERLKIAGGDLDVDKFIVDTMGEDQRSTQETMKIKSLALAWTYHFIKGSEASNPRGFDGLQARITGNQLIAAGGTSGGDALSLDKLDEAIDAVDDPTHLIMSKAMRRKLTAAARDTSVGGDLRWERDEFGMPIAMYNDLPILIADYDNNGARILDFNEANPGGGSAVGTSIYCVSMGDGKVAGLENGTLDARDLGELETKPAFRTRVEWYSTMGVFHPRAASRLYGIKNAAVTK